MPDSLNDANLDAGTGPVRSILLNHEGDLAFVAGHMVLVRGVPAIVQEVRCRCRFWRGESFTDVTAGVDFINEVFTKPPNLLAAQAAFRRELLATAGVVSVDEVRAEFVSAERRLVLDYKATITDGTVITDTVTAGV